MAFKIVSMVLRSFVLSIMVLGMFFISECQDLIRLDHFIMLGICGGFSIVNLGLLLEAGFQIDTDKCIEALFLVIGILLNLLNIVLAFTDFYYTLENRKSQTLNIGMTSALSIVFYAGDLVLLLIK